ncbi:MAG: hypothetical protein NC341_03610 [Blautia sp.]|nr:hypothetical protein [Blautia sp.]MCM1200684.1 hypothetical protein [Bacteroides fragilis]
MAAFFADLLDNFPKRAFLEKVRVKFHYEETRAEELRAAAEEMLPFLYREAFWERGQVEAGSGAGGADLPGRRYERVVMSLGAGLDILQERYSGQGSLSKCYMLEVLAGELLMQGCGAYNRYIGETADWHVARYHFPGSEEAYPLEKLPGLLTGLTDRVTCNAAFCLLPKKSVAFAAELTQDEKVRCEGICAGCGNMHCVNRTADDSRIKQMWARMADVPLNYGYSRILGRL